MRLFDTLNAWELGDYQGLNGLYIKHSCLLRTQKLTDMNAEQLDTLVNEYHLKTVVDFRMTGERHDYPDPELPGVNNYHVRILDEEMLKAQLGQEPGMAPINDDGFASNAKYLLDHHVFSDDMYIGFVEGMGKQGYADFFRYVIETTDGAILWHCTSGKDRTGVAAMLLLGVLGVDEDTIVNDYALTNTYNKDIIVHGLTTLKAALKDDYSDDLIMMVEGVKPGCMRRVIHYINNTYGSITDYVVRELGVSQNNIVLLQQRYLERR